MLGVRYYKRNTFKIIIFFFNFTGGVVARRVRQMVGRDRAPGRHRSRRRGVGGAGARGEALRWLHLAF